MDTEHFLARWGESERLKEGGRGTEALWAPHAAYWENVLMPKGVKEAVLA